MNDNHIATVGDLIAALTDYDPATPVRIATESAEFMDHTIGLVVRTPGDPDNDCTLPNDAPVVRIGTEAEVPVTRIACVVDLGEYLDPDGDRAIADEARDEALHRSGCAFALPTAD